MKKYVKYIVLALGSVGIFIFTLVLLSILSDYFNTNYDVTLILPMLCLSLLVVAIICTIVSAFKFSNDKRLKTILVITIVLYLLSATFHILGRVINPYVNNTNNVPAVTSYTYKKSVDKDVFLNEFFNLLAVDNSFTYTKTSDTISEDGNFTTSNYTLTSSPIPLTMIAFDVKFNNTSNSLESVSIVAAPNNSVWVALIFNWAALSLDPNVDIEQLDKQCGLSPFVEGTLRAETDMFSVLKMSSDKFISATISIK